MASVALPSMRSGPPAGPSPRYARCVRGSPLILLLILLLNLLACSCSERSDTPGSDTSEQPVASPPSRIEEVGVVRCGDPDAQALAPYTELDPGPDWWTQEVTFGSFGGGVVVADLTGDDHLDIFLPTAGQDRLYVGQPDGTFADQTATRLPALAWDESDSASAADADGDGDLDLYVGNRGPNVLYRNDEGIFIATTDAGVDDGDYYTAGSAWGDMDRDGDLDLITLNHGRDGIPIADFFAGTPPAADPNHLYENVGDLGFEDHTAALGQAGSDAYSFAGGWLPLDGDTTASLYFVNDLGPLYRPNVALRGDGAGNFSPIEDRGLDVATFGMGLGVGELGTDGLPDLLITSWDELHLLESAPDGVWYDVAVARGLVPGEGRHLGWGAELADLDNDGDLDAMVAFGWLVMPEEEERLFEEELGLRNPRDQPDGVWRQEGDGTFTQVAEAWGLAQTGNGRGFVLADLDGNGFLDVVKRDLAGPARIYLAACDQRAWLVIAPRQEGSNPFAIGARIEVVAGARTWVTDVRAGGTSYGSSGPPEVHVGLGDLDAIDQVRIRWPDGSETVTGALSTRQKVRIWR